MGGGLLADVFKDVTYRIRKYIYGYEEESLGIVESSEFTAYLKIMGTLLKDVPRGCLSDCPAVEYLEYKSRLIGYYLKDGVSDDLERLVKIAGGTCLLIKLLNDLLDRVLDGLVVPEGPI